MSLSGLILQCSYSQIIRSEEKKYSEGQGDLVSRFINPINHLVTLVTPISNLLTKSPDPSKQQYTFLLKFPASLDPKLHDGVSRL